MTTQTDLTTYQSWLAHQLSSLAEREFIVLTLPETAEVPVAPYVQFLRIDDQVASECSGARFFGGPLDISPELDTRIRALGWTAPQEPAHLNPASGNYERYWEPHRTDEVAELTIETLKLLGAESVEDISFERDQ